MKNTLLILLISILFMVTAWAQDEITIVDNKVYKNPQRPASLFNHDNHNKKAKLDDCGICHHVYKDKKLVKDETSEDKKCVQCHPVKTANSEQRSLTKAFHQRCKGCHTKLKSGPVMCGQCHKKL